MYHLGSNIQKYTLWQVDSCLGNFLPMRKDGSKKELQGGLSSGSFSRVNMEFLSGCIKTQHLFSHTGIGSYDTGILITL